MTAPRRRWFSFSLRTLFVVVTTGAVALAWLQRQQRWADERWELLTDEDSGILETGPVNPPPPFPLQFFGAIGWQSIRMYSDASAQQIARARRVYPEANVSIDEDYCIKQPEDSAAAQSDRP